MLIRNVDSTLAYLQSQGGGAGSVGNGANLQDLNHTTLHNIKPWGYIGCLICALTKEHATRVPGSLEWAKTNITKRRYPDGVRNLVGIR